MSARWFCIFSVIGTPEEIARFCEGLPGPQQAPDDDPLWHEVSINAQAFGFLSVTAFRRYGGYSSTEQMVFEFPALSFVGSLSADADPFAASTFEGRAGRTTWREWRSDEDENGEPIGAPKEIALTHTEGETT